ncbi:hypothetical protein [Ruegeria arenilitoris]|uniref:hypothetical protein n=1 Tax=Ruegeria arenilitoris TaxID=1173585 RepID=UPI0014808545|nr:hypothetical protein [Ruegeria arenilitoris]
MSNPLATKSGDEHCLNCVSIRFAGGSHGAQTPKQTLPQFGYSVIFHTNFPKCDGQQSYTITFQQTRLLCGMLNVCFVRIAVARGISANDRTEPNTGMVVV